MTDFDPVYIVTEPDFPAVGSPVRPARIVIFVGHGDRAWMEARVPDGAVRSLGNIRVVIPERPDFDAALLDALLAFWPERFRSCPSLADVEARLLHRERLDFHLHAERIPKEWQALRREARPIFERLVVARVARELLVPART
jgi:hypothetical protein